MQIKLGPDIQPVSFITLCNGTAFQVNQKVYIKIKIIADRDNNIFNCLDPINGLLWHVPDGSPVIPRHDLVIREERQST